MITKIKTALQGAEFRTDGGWVAPSHNAVNTDDTPIEPDVGEIDPYGQTTDLENGANHDHVGMDQIFGILRNRRRRYVLKDLSMTRGPSR